MKTILNFFTLRSFGRFMFDFLIFFIIFAAATAESISIPQDAYRQLCDSKDEIQSEFPLMHSVCVERSKK